MHTHVLLWRTESVPVYLALLRLQKDDENLNAQIKVKVMVVCPEQGEDMTEESSMNYLPPLCVDRICTQLR